jgi:AmmeMemoRadiSam system protein A
VPLAPVQSLMHMLTDLHKRALVRVARDSVVAQVTGLPRPHWQSSELPDASGAFVTIKCRGELRGCLGTLECRGGLGFEIIRCAADAASTDPRFTPVVRAELSELSIQVSVLGPLEQIDPADLDAITLGRHGLVVELGRHRGLLLPQVAIEWEWTREQFLTQTCIKAGLRSDAWKRGASVYRFDAVVFGEQD